MRENSNAFFDVIAVAFFALTVIVLVVVFGIASGAMEAPIFAPATALPLPTEVFIPTRTPSPMPGANVTPGADALLTPVETPAPGAQ